MKTIENKQTSITDTVEGQVKELCYVDLLKIVMNVPPAQGYTIAEMKQRLDIYSALIPESASVEIQDADLQVIVNCVNNFKWGAVHKDIVEFAEYLEKL